MPAPTEEQPRLGRTFALNAGWIAGERITTTSRTLLGGPSAKGLASRFLGWKQTPEEMEQWLAGRGMFTSGAKDQKFFYRVFGKSMGLGKHGMLGSPWAPSSWMAAMRINQRPGAYGGWALNIAREATDRSFGNGVAGYAANAGRFAAGQSGLEGSRWRGWGRGAELVEASAAMTSAEGAEAMNRLLRMGRYSVITDGKYGGGYLKDAITASLFKAPEGSWATAVGQRYGSGIGKTRVGQWMAGGMARNIAGVTESEMGGAALTTLAKVGLPLVEAGGVFLKGLNWALLAKDATKLAYHTGELYYYKIPKAMYASVAGQLTRPSFASGDAALLTGVPANNRMRAVQQIQGSRLNARSALGNEAGLLAGHFG